MQADVPVPVSITAYSDKTFTFVSGLKAPRLAEGDAMSSGSRSCLLAGDKDATNHLFCQKGVGTEERQPEAGPPEGGHNICEAGL